MTCSSRPSANQMKVNKNLEVFTTVHHQLVVVVVVFWNKYLEFKTTGLIANVAWADITVSRVSSKVTTLVLVLVLVRYLSGPITVAWCSVTFGLFEILPL